MAIYATLYQFPNIDQIHVPSVPLLADLFFRFAGHSQSIKH